MTTPTIHNLAADIADRIEAFQADSKFNNTQVIERLLKPVYDELFKVKMDLSDKNLSLAMMRTMRDHAVMLEEQQRAIANDLRQKLSSLEQTV